MILKTLKAKHTKKLPAPKRGYVHTIDAVNSHVCSNSCSWEDGKKLIQHVELQNLQGWNPDETRRGSYDHSLQYEKRLKVAWTISKQLMVGSEKTDPAPPVERVAKFDYSN